MKRIAAAALMAAGTITAGPLHAADLAVAEPVEYVRICDAFGTGFFYIPGTETCLRVAGRIRADYNLYFDFDDGDGQFDDQGFDDTDDEGYRFRARGYVYLDSRTSTEFGLLRSYLEIYWTSDSLDRGDFGGGGGTTEFDLELEQAFIQYGGLTFGRIQSFYDFLDAEFTEAQTFDPGLSDRIQNVIAYTFGFGNGISATIALEDNASRRYGVENDFRVNPVAFGDGTIESRYGGAQIPDIVGNFRIEQDWGTAQAMAAGHYVNALGIIDPAGDRGPLRTTDEAYGFAVGGGVVVNLPFGNDTSIGVTGTYSHGALDYASTDISAPSGAYDAVFDSDGDLDLTDAFSVSGGVSTDITSTVSIAGQLGYVSVSSSDVADVDDDGTIDDLDVQNFDAQAWLAYEPVDDFLMGVGAEYRHVDPEGSDSGSVLTTFFRAQRTF